MAFNINIIHGPEIGVISKAVICSNCKLKYKQFTSGTDLRLISLIITCPYCDNIMIVNP